MVMEYSKEELIEEQIHYAWPSPKDEDNEPVIPLIKQLTDLGAKVIEIPEGATLGDHVLLPMVEAPNGYRHFGLNSIQEYVEGYKV